MKITFKNEDDFIQEVIKEVENLKKSYCKEDMPPSLIRLLKLTSNHRLKESNNISSLDQFFSEFYNIENQDFFETQSEIELAQKKLFDSVFSNKYSKSIFYEVANCDEQMGLFLSFDNKYVYLLSKENSGEIIKGLTDLKNVEYLVYIDTEEKDGCFLGEAQIVKDSLFTFDTFKSSVEHINSLINEQ